MKKQSIVFILLFFTFIAKAQQNEWNDVEKVFGKKGTVADNVFKITFPRSDLEIKIGDLNVSPGLALTTWVNGIQVTAIHNHMLYDNPRLFMMHFWAVDDPAKLAKGLKEALDKTNSKK